MLAEGATTHTEIKGPLLDVYLAHGWYRSGYMVFTTHFVAPFDGDDTSYRVYWLRYNVRNVILDRKAHTIIAANKNFTIDVGPLRLTEEVINLHKLYAASLRFKTQDNLWDLLLDPTEVFDSYIIEIRDNGKLIGGGIFDRGDKSIAGIINFYDPAYKKYSPGKMLILQKYLYCFHNNIPYYYPGYFTPHNPLFDYKLFLDKAATEVFIPENNSWIPYIQYVNLVK